MCYRPNAHSNGRKKISSATVLIGFQALLNFPPCIFGLPHRLKRRRDYGTPVASSSSSSSSKTAGAEENVCHQNVRALRMCRRRQLEPVRKCSYYSHCSKLRQLFFFFFFHLRERQRGRHFSFSECGTAVLSTSCRRVSPPRCALVNATLGLCSAASKNLTGHV